MSFLGKWKFASMMSFSDEGERVWLTPEQLMAQPIEEEDEEVASHEKKERQQMIDTVLEVAEDGKMYALMPIPADVPQEEIDEAVKKYGIKLRNGYMEMEAHEWEDRDGVFYYNSGIRGEFLGEETDPWLKGSDEEGNLMLMFTKYVRA